MQVYNKQKYTFLPQSIQMELSKKPKHFSEFFALFLKSTLNFEGFEKKDDLRKKWLEKCLKSPV